MAASTASTAEPPFFIMHMAIAAALLLVNSRTQREYKKPSTVTPTHCTLLDVFSRSEGCDSQRLHARK
jgi:hypothetical protein